MARRAINRQIYFEKHCKPAPSVSEYLMALHKSPYKTHRRMAVLLADETDKLIAQKKKKEDLEAFAKTLEV